MDIPEAHRWKVHRLLGALKLPYLQVIDPPKPSLGASKNEAWSTINIHFSALLGCALEREMLVKWLKGQIREFQPLLGWIALIRDADALLLEATSISAAQALSDLCVSQLTVSPTLTIISTTAGPEIWSARLTKTWTEHPLNTGEKVRYRPSLGGDEKFATIAALPTQIAGAKARRGHGPADISQVNPKSLQATLSIPLGATHDIEDWSTKLFEKLAGSCLVVLSRAKDEKALGLREWRPILDYEGKWAGKLIVQCTDEAELRRLHTALHGKQVTVGEHSASVGVHSDFAKLDL